MSHRVSFIVPTRNAERTLASCLKSVRAQDHDDVELIVVDNDSQDRTVDIARAFADRVVHFGPERCAQRNQGARVATGSVLVFADADMVFERGVAREAAALLLGTRDSEVGAVVLPELAFGDGFLARCRALEKQLYLGDPAIEAARAVRAGDFEAVGGYNETFVGGEDWELADRVVASGNRRLARTHARVWHDEGHVEMRSMFAKKRYYGRGLATYFAMPARRPLVRRALREPGRLAAHPVLSAGLAVLKTVELSGAALGVLDARRREGVRTK